MSGSNHTMRSVPLDLTNKTRERGSSAQTGDQGRPRHTPERQVKLDHKCSNGHGILPTEPRDSCDGAESQTTQTDDLRGNRTREGPKQTRPVTPNVKCITQTDAAGKPADSSVSKLPLRKRPFPPDVDHDTSGPRNIPQSPSSKLQIQTGAPRISNPFHEIQSFNDSQFVQQVPYRKFTICLFLSTTHFIFQVKTLCSWCVILKVCVSYLVEVCVPNMIAQSWSVQSANHSQRETIEQISRMFGSAAFKTCQWGCRLNRGVL